MQFSYVTPLKGLVKVVVCDTLVIFFKQETPFYCIAF